MSEPIKGRCLCGNIQYMVKGKSLGGGQCYCRDCRYSCGGGPANAFLVLKDDLMVLEGQTTVYETETHLGNGAWREFCGRCGTPLFGGKSSSPTTVAIYAGTLEEDSAFEPQAISWASAAPSWAHLNPDLRAYPQDIGPDGG